eukprot:scaffold19400_cov104-Isochrysis_galbana.AAC.6
MPGEQEAGGRGCRYRLGAGAYGGPDLFLVVLCVAGWVGLWHVPCAAARARGHRMLRTLTSGWAGRGTVQKQNPCAVRDRGDAARRSWRRA